MKYKVHRLDVRMTKDQDKLELFLNSLKGEVIAIIPNVAPFPFTWHVQIDFVLVVEKISE